MSTSPHCVGILSLVLGKLLRLGLSQRILSKILSTKMRITVRVPLRGVQALLLRRGGVEVEEFAIEELGAIGDATVATDAYCIGILSLELVWELVRLLLV